MKGLRREGYAFGGWSLFMLSALQERAKLRLVEEGSFQNNVQFMSAVGDFPA